MNILIIEETNANPKCATNYIVLGRQRSMKLHPQGDGSSSYHNTYG